ncbi:MAG: integrase core domain-containing protein [Acidobacteriia bacterium]|nr:integrase core domain-containing protein [Terriglobia bacterium]
MPFRCVVGRALERHLGTILAVRALQRALESRQPEPGMIHHSDRGVQYACSDYVEMLQQHGIEISMSRVGNPYDNAQAESFIKTLKQEEVNGQKYRHLGHLRQSLAEFLENLYNGRRLHSALGYQSPREYEASLMRSAAEDTIQGRVEKGGGCPLPPRPHPPQNLNSSVPVFSVSE